MAEYILELMQANEPDASIGTSSITDNFWEITADTLKLMAGIKILAGIQIS